MWRVVGALGAKKWGRDRSPLSLLATRHFISTTSSQHCHLYTEFAVCPCLFFFSSVITFFSLFLLDLFQPSLVATTHYMRTIDMRPFRNFFLCLCRDATRCSVSLFLVLLCSLSTVIVGDIIFTVAILVIYERFVVMHNMWNTKVGACKLVSSIFKVFANIYLFVC